MSGIEDEHTHELHTDEEDYSRPFRVVVIQDLRDTEEINLTSRLDGQSGWCLGMYEYPDRTRKRPEAEAKGAIELQPELVDDGGDLFYNPLIFSDTGVYVWGIECWFRDDKGWMKNLPPELAQEAVEIQKQRLRTALGIDIEISLN